MTNTETSLMKWINWMSPWVLWSFTLLGFVCGLMVSAIIWVVLAIVNPKELEPAKIVNVYCDSHSQVCPR